MHESFNIEKFVKQTFGGANTINFEEAGIKLKKSAQVRIKNEKPKDYYEITGSMVSAKEDLCKDTLLKQTKANIGSLENQQLQEGDVIIPMRSKFRYAKVISPELLADGLPIVVAKGHLVFRTGNLDKARFLKFYLELKEIREYINTDRYTSEKTKLPISMFTAETILVPDVINSDLRLFLENSDKVHQAVNKAEELYQSIDNLYTLQRIKFCKDGIDNPHTYTDSDQWLKLAKKIEELTLAAKGA